MRDGTQNHGLNELNGHSRGMTPVCIYQKTGKVGGHQLHVLEGAGPGHDVNGIEQGVDNVLALPA